MLRFLASCISWPPWIFFLTTTHRNTVETKFSLGQHASGTSLCYCIQAWPGKLQLLYFYFFLCGTKCSAFGWDFSNYKILSVSNRFLCSAHWTEALRSWQGHAALVHGMELPTYLLFSLHFSVLFSTSLSFLLPLAINPIIWAYFLLPAYNGLCTQPASVAVAVLSLAVLGRALRQKLCRFGEHLQTTLSKLTNYYCDQFVRFS